MPGYDFAKVIFKQPEVLDKYTCPECHFLLQDAVQPSCGHWLCRSCADIIIARENDPRCPKEECGDPLEEDEDQMYYPDRFVRKDILGLSVSCEFHHMGCGWEGTFGALKEHLKECDYNLAHCELCQKSLRHDEIDSHQSECPGVMKRCPLSEIGCESSSPMTIPELDKHFDIKNIQHMELLVKKMSNLEVTRASASLRSYDSGFGSLQLSTIDSVEKDCAVTSSDRVLKKPPQLKGGTSLDRRMSVFDEEVPKLRSSVKSSMLKELHGKDEEIASLKSAVMKLEKAVRSKNERHDFRLSLIENKLEKAKMIADFKDRDFRLSLIENSYCNYDGIMVWKIPQFSQRMVDAQSGKYTSIFSLPFYSGHYGYKMCLRLYILGDGIGKGNYMSLFFVLMKGEFDNTLQWPFTYKVTFKLLNQKNGRDVVDTFQPDPAGKQPKSDMNMNIAPGCPRFVSHTTLKSGGYIEEDTVFIKCIIDARGQAPH